MKFSMKSIIAFSIIIFGIVLLLVSFSYLSQGSINSSIVTNNTVTINPNKTETPQSTIIPSPTPEATPTLSTSTTVTETPKSSSSEIDTSWITTVNQYLNDSMPYPDWKIDYTLNAYSISLFNNGTRTFIGASNGNDFSAYLLSIISKANKQLSSSISDSYVERITQSDKVLALRIRLATMFSQGGFHAWDFYFVLDDTLNQELKGLVFIEHDLDNTSMWQSWAITK